MDARVVGEILVRRGALPADRLDEVLKLCEERGSKVQDVILVARIAPERDVLIALAAETGLDLVERLAVETVPVDLIGKVPINFAKQNRLVPIGYEDGSVRVAVSDPLDTFALDDLRVMLGCPIVAVVAPTETIVDAINKLYERQEEQLSDIEKDTEQEELQDLLDLTDEAPIIRWVNSLFYAAVKQRASDIHIESTEKEVVVRYRIDGVLKEEKHANRSYMANIIARIKIMSGLNIAEKRLPQDGRIGLRIAGKTIDVRVSTIPTSHGERVVLRLLNKEMFLRDVSELGFSAMDLSLIDSLIRRPHGILLVTGPTGSGKSTSLYGFLQRINTPEKNILTIEDPVEYDLKGISQTAVNPKIHLTFASGLRSFLRQDPDVIMVGEIRDAETAEIAIHASLTGHLVFSTIHTNDAPGAVTRLVEMKIEPFLVSSSLLAVLAQRLVRVLCPHCREPYRPTPAHLAEIGLDPDTVGRRAQRAAQAGPRPVWVPDVSRPVFYRPKGCEECLGTGYRGRTGIYELLLVSDAIQQLILKNADSNALRRQAIDEGMDTLRDDGARKVLEGATSLEEILKVAAEGTATG